MKREKKGKIHKCAFNYIVYMSKCSIHVRIINGFLKISQIAAEKNNKLHGHLYRWIEWVLAFHVSVHGHTCKMAYQEKQAGMACRESRAIALAQFNPHLLFFSSREGGKNKKSDKASCFFIYCRCCWHLQHMKAHYI